MKRLLFLTMFFCIPLSASFSQTVYVTKSGKKFHSAECRYSATANPISLSDAISRGYESCKICNPVTSSSFDNNRIKEDGQRSESQYTEKVQCSAMTKSGKRCKRMVKNPNGLCWQHGGD